VDRGEYIGLFVAFTRMGSKSCPTLPFLHPLAEIHGLALALERRELVSLRMGHYIVIGVESSLNVLAHGDAREGPRRGNWRMEWVANTHHTTSEHGVSSITTADAHTSAASIRLN